MLQKHRLYGLMAGITAGFAVWGFLPFSGAGTGAQPVFLAEGQNAAENPEAPGAVVHEDQENEENSEKQPCPVELHALSAVLMDGDSGRILAAKNEREFRPMASTTKIMTCILALEEAQPEQVCVFSKKAVVQPKVHLGAGAGSEFYLRDLLYSLMLESHNDTAVAVAEAVAGSTEEFSRRMNRKAAALGCTDTYFITPNGLDAQETAEDGSVKTHGTTAADLARIMRYCVMESPKREEFLKITQTSDYYFSDVSGKRQFSCRNHNALLNQMSGILSGKTGFTGGAGYSYVGAREDDGRTFILVLLGCGWPPHRTWKWSDAKALFAYGAEHFTMKDIYREISPARIPVENGTGSFVLPVTRLRPEEKHIRLLLSGEDQVRVRTELPEYLSAPIAAGKKVGSIVYELNGKEFRRIPLYADRKVKKRDLRYYLKMVFDRFMSGNSAGAGGVSNISRAL